MGRITGMTAVALFVFIKGAYSELTTDIIREEHHNGGPLPVGADARLLILPQR
jgi:hypothetical protein